MKMMVGVGEFCPICHFGGGLCPGDFCLEGLCLGGILSYILVQFRA